MAKKDKNQIVFEYLPYYTIKTNVFNISGDSEFLKDYPQYKLYQLFTLKGENGAILNRGQNGNANTLETASKR